MGHKIKDIPREVSRGSEGCTETRDTCPTLHLQPCFQKDICGIYVRRVISEDM